jgi:hypothetical protein
VVRDRRSTLGELVGVIGAAAIVTDELFAPIRLVHWLAAGAPNSEAHAIAAAE